MLIGEYRHTIDGKRRLAIPSKMRKQLGNEAVLTRGLDGCLTLYPTEEWKRESEKLSRIPSSLPEGRAYARIMLAGADQVAFDNLGRILIPEHLAKYAGLEKNVIVGGLNTRLEIWSEQKWNTYKKKAEENVEDFASKLGDMGV